ncbi:MAG: DMT family transporter [Candidatus Bathyarchaeia archaeon]|jgi:drug/metabolite transporter (DMT)-like permease
MTLEIGILFAITTMLSWGVADFFAKKAIDKTGYRASLVINQSVSLVPIFICVILFFRVPSFTVDLVFTILLTGVFGIIGYIFLYRGFQKGNVSVVSPISACWAIITTLLAVFLFKEQLTLLQIIGVVVVFVGVFLASTNLAELRKSMKYWRHNGVMDGIICMIAWGITYALIKPIVAVAGPIMALLLFRAVAILTLFSWVGVTKTKISLPARLIFLFIIIAGLLDFSGFLTFNLSLTTEFVSIVGPIAATYPAVTVMLAYVFLKERVANNQKIGIAAILTGLALISLS